MLPVPTRLAARVISAAELVPRKVAPGATVIVVLAAMMPEPRSSRTPLLTVVPPVWVFAPERISVPVPVLFRLTRPRPVAPLAKIPA